MSKSVEFYFDYGSPFSYLGYRRLLSVADRHDATVIYRIMSLGAVFKATGNQSPVSVMAKRPNAANDLRRFAKRFDVPFRDNPFFPINTLGLMRGALVAEEDGMLPAYNEAMFAAMWADGRNLGDPRVVGDTVAAAGIDPLAFARRVAEEPIKQRLIARNAEAVERGVFGAPTFFVDGEMFFGQDRLDFVEEALAGRSYL